MVDILLSRVLFISNGSYTTVIIMSSFAKLTPQFLGQLCFIKNMIGVDQQFIHYVHPVVVVFLILAVISKLAKNHFIILHISSVYFTTPNKTINISRY